MRVQLKWAVASLWLLALPAALPSEAGATDAPVPRECHRPDLSPEARARCDFIARTPDLCRRSGLSRRTQLFCDQQRFADVPVFNVVRLAANGAVRSIRLIETATGRAVYTGYPYGLAFAASDPRDRLLRMRVEDLESFLDGRPTPGSSRGNRRAAAPALAQAAPTGFATGLPIGWNQSTGITPGQCLNYTINTPSNNVEQRASARRTPPAAPRSRSISQLQ